MSIFRIGETIAQEGRTEELRNFLSSILPIIKSAAGCQGCQLFQDQNNLARFIIVEQWDSVESHQASVKEIPPEMLAEIRPLIGPSPAGSYFDLLNSLQ
jgi:quinol monooxygenase YgiN